MGAPGSRLVLAGVSGLVTLGLAAWLGWGRPTQAQSPPRSPRASVPNERPAPPPSIGPEADRPRSDSEADRSALPEWAGQELLARAREELATLELRLSAKKALLREAERALDVDKSLQVEYERMGKKGLTSPLGRKRTAQGVLRAEADRAVLQADVAETEAQFQQARRRLGILQKYGAAALPSVESVGEQSGSLERRVKILEQKVQLLQNDLQNSQKEIDFLVNRVRGQIR